MRIPLGKLRRALEQVLLEEGFEEERAAACALLFAEASRDGVHSHGLNRFPRFVRMIRNGCVDPRGEAARVGGRGAFERWDGRAGPGNLNAMECMGRAIELAREHGIGCVALRNTNHWMRAGSYGWQAAEAGMIGICWTNTLPNLPPWGSAQPLVGNNPLVIAVPHPPEHVVLDMAMSQYSYGALEGYVARGEQLPVAGGFDGEGHLTTDPSAILASGRPLPIGYWKGSGLSLLLDLAAATLAAGKATGQLGADPELESELSQVFLAIDPSLDDPDEGPDDGIGIAERVIDSLEAAEPGLRIPGKRVLQERQRSLAEGVQVDETIWRWVAGDAEGRRLPPG